MPSQPSCRAIRLSVSTRVLTHLLWSVFAVVPTAKALYPVGSYPDANSFRDIEVIGQLAYIADGGAGLVILDVSDPQQPLLLGGVDTPGYASGVAVSGNRAYVADYRSGLRIINVSDPAYPTEVGSLPFTGEAKSVAVEGNFAYVADYAFGLQVIDVSSSSSPSLVASHPASNCTDVAVVENIVYLACAGLEILDASNPSDIRSITQLELPGRVTAVELVDDIAYLGHDTEGLIVVDVSSPADPQILDVSFLGFFARGLDVDGDRILVVDWDNALRVFSADPQVSLAEIGSIATTSRPYAVAVSGNHAYLATGAGGLEVFDARPDCSDGFDNDDDGEIDLADPSCTSADDPSERPACSDGYDNDGDGSVDYPLDLGCDDADDTDESTGRACDDGIDNDGDEASDYPDDPGCDDIFDDSERNDAAVCDDGVDNDDDGGIDYPGDPECDDPLDFSEAPACSDGIDNDDDDWIDFPDDPGCATPEADSERTGAICDDGLDNDGDTLVDAEDPGCIDENDDSELNLEIACDDGIDNDDDGNTDFPDDPGCLDPSQDLENPACDDGIDNDDDGGTDFPEDPGCAASWSVSEAFACADGIDNDDDGLIDFGQDPGCASPNDASERTGSACDDGIDNDGDDLIDAADPGCRDLQSNLENPQCNDGIDNDGDRLTDFPEDGGCESSFDTTEFGEGIECDDGLDNDGDGLIDFPDDPGCEDVGDTQETNPLIACDDGKDNDGDGDIDFPADADCADPTQNYEVPECSDGIDNDGDRLIDYPDDVGCLGPEQNLEAPDCSDGIDNDGDGAIDLDDSGCRIESDLSEHVLDPGNVLVVRPRSLLRIDPETGEQEVISSGNLFEYLVDVALDGPGDIYVSDAASGSIFHVDPDTGAQTLVIDGLDLGGIGLLAGGGLTMTADGLLIVAGAQGLTWVDPEDGSSGTLIEGTGGVGIFGNYLDVVEQSAAYTSDPSAPTGIYFSTYSASAADPTMDIYWLGTDDAEPSLVYSTSAVLGPGFNGGLAIHPDGDVLFAHAGDLLRIDPAEAPDGLVSEAPSSIGGFGGISIDPSGTTLLIEHCGPSKALGCTPEGIRIMDDFSGQLILGGDFLQFSLELEQVPFACSDGVDNDGDLMTDSDDPECFGPRDPTETASLAVPEPQSWMLAGAALCALVGIARVRRVADQSRSSQ